MNRGISMNRPITPNSGQLPDDEIVLRSTDPTVSRALWCTPMRLEARAVRSALPAGLAEQVQLTGAGRAHSEHAARTAAWQDADGIGVVGIAGALDPKLQAGDVVVADRVWGPSGPSQARQLPAAALVAAQLRATGLRVFVGPVVSQDHLVSCAGDRQRQARTGALAVDMESFWLLPADRPGLVVRVIADTAGQRLLQPRTLGRVRTAVRALPALAPVLAQWGAALGSREVLLPGPRSFCAGVERAIEIVELALHQRGAPVYVRKQIVHNRHVVAELEQRGAVFVDELDQIPAGATTVFSAHGVSPAVWTAARSRQLDVIDATCPLVTKVHTEVRRFSDRGDTVIFIGHAGHEESEGTMGERPGQTVLVQDVLDARTVQVADPDRVTYLVQTTLSAYDVDDIVSVLRSRFPRLRAPATDDICYATTNRQDALAAVAEESDLILVVGSENSSNSLRLVETAQRLGTAAHLIDDAGDIDLGWLAGARTIGITAGASAPTTLVDEVVDSLHGLGPVSVQHRQHVTENIRFTVPKEVRTL